MSGRKAGSPRSPRETQVYLSDTALENIDVEANAPEPIGHEVPDRDRYPYEWEMYWRWVMRPGGVGGGVWRAYRLEPVVWPCQHCGEAILDVQQRGRPPLYCSDACKQAAYRVRRVT